MAALEAKLEASPAPVGKGRARARAVEPSGVEAPAADDRFWVLNRVIAETASTAGAVVYAGVARLSDGTEYRWQVGRTTEALLDQDWAELAGRLGALGHPLRLQLLRAVLHGADNLQALQALPGVGTTGQLYHHLRDLQNAGWVSSARRGHYAIPGERVVPLLAVLSAALG